ncbi:unnamed protein product [Caenorhabditis auriculariae]|uniref:Uncharacterized protein n=1 Tax=Caenorhabditis auriculariae TaxID=2777116 RepID=A0A8S1GX64_9PELO|nr:unnamed protein product [Caenorhabditis auriculariae]
MMAWKVSTGNVGGKAQESAQGQDERPKHNASQRPKYDDQRAPRSTLWPCSPCAGGYNETPAERSLLLRSVSPFSSFSTLGRISLLSIYFRASLPSTLVFGRRTHTLQIGLNNLKFLPPNDLF